MAELPTRAGPTALTTSSATIKTAGGAGTWIIVRSIVATNVDTVERTVTVGVGTSNTDTDAKQIARGVPVPAGDAVQLLPNGFMVLAGHASTPDLIYALCSANDKVNLTVSMVEGP